MDILNIECANDILRASSAAPQKAPPPSFLISMTFARHPYRGVLRNAIPRLFTIEREFAMQKKREKKRIKRKNRARKSIPSVSNDIDLGRCATLSGLLFPRLPILSPPSHPLLPSTSFVSTLLAFSADCFPSSCFFCVQREISARIEYNALYVYK